MDYSRMIMDYSRMIDDYAAGPAALRKAVSGLTPEQLDARPVPGKWSIREVVAHLSDFEPIYADRMKWVLAQEEPLLPGGDPDLFAKNLAYASRDIEEELALIEAVRKHAARILRTVPPEDFQRAGRHSEDGLLKVETLLKRITGHLPHHLKFIEEKRAALGV